MKVLKNINYKNTDYKFGDEINESEFDVAHLKQLVKDGVLEHVHTPKRLDGSTKTHK